LQGLVERVGAGGVFDGGDEAVWKFPAGILPLGTMLADVSPQSGAID